MPARTLYCTKCNKTYEDILDASVEALMCNVCHEPVSFLPQSFGFRLTEKVNKYWNKNLTVGAQEKAKEKSKEHMRTVEMHDIIARHGIKNLKNHPLIKDGRIRKKDE